MQRFETVLRTAFDTEAHQELLPGQCLEYDIGRSRRGASRCSRQSPAHCGIIRRQASSPCETATHSATAATVAPIVILSNRPKGVGSCDNPALASQLRVKLGVMRPP